MQDASIPSIAGKQIHVKPQAQQRNQTQDQNLDQNRIQQLGFRLFPGVCLLCRQRSKRDFDLCPICEATLPLLETACSRCAAPLNHPGICGYCQRKPPRFTAVVAPYRYQFPIDRIIQSFKYSGKFSHGRVLASLLAEHLLHPGSTLNPNDAQPSMPDLLIPVPLHWRRQFRRGFNQAELIAREVSRHLNIPINSHLISRTRHTRVQENLSRRKRQSNLARAFTVDDHIKKGLEGLSIAVVDDVVTTGSTADAVASCLMRAGAKQVQIWAIARTPLEK